MKVVTLATFSQIRGPRSREARRRVGGWMSGAFAILSSLALLACTDAGSRAGGGRARSLAELGIVDGASEGLSKSVAVKAGAAATLDLDTGARLSIPEGATSAALEIGLKRPPDVEALPLLAKVDREFKIASAPYVITPHGTKLDADAELDIPVAHGKADRLVVAYLDDESDDVWKVHDAAHVSEDGSTMTATLKHFSVYVVLERSIAAPPSGFACAEQGLEQGNSNLTGHPALDAYFAAVVDHGERAASSASLLQTTIEEIASAAGLDRAAAAGDLGELLEQQMMMDFSGTVLRVFAQDAQCPRDAGRVGEVAVQCLSDAGCTLADAHAACLGRCSVSAVGGKCEADADVVCAQPSADGACEGECLGTCTEQRASAACFGSCDGSCSGVCYGVQGTSAGQCSGYCLGACDGACGEAGNAALSCQGTCDGTCRYRPPTGSCAGPISCELKPPAAQECPGSCDGEVSPPRTSCAASPACEAVARLSAVGDLTCNVASLHVEPLRAASPLTSEDETRLQALATAFNTHFRALIQAHAGASLLREAVERLADDDANAIRAELGELAAASQDPETAYRIANCAARDLDDAPRIIATANEELVRRLGEAASLLDRLLDEELPE